MITNKIPQVIIDREEFENTVKGLNAAVFAMQEKGISIPSMTVQAHRECNDLLEKYQDMNISQIIDVLTEPGENLYMNITKILEDKKITLADIKPGFGVYKAIGKIVSKFPEMKKEYDDLTNEEINVIIMIIMTSVQSKI